MEVAAKEKITYYTKYSTSCTKRKTNNAQPETGQYAKWGCGGYSSIITKGSCTSVYCVTKEAKNGISSSFTMTGGTISANKYNNCTYIQTGCYTNQTFQVCGQSISGTTIAFWGCAGSIGSGCSRGYVANYITGTVCGAKTSVTCSSI